MTLAKPPSLSLSLSDFGADFVCVWEWWRNLGDRVLWCVCFVFVSRENFYAFMFFFSLSFGIRKIVVKNRRVYCLCVFSVYFGFTESQCF